MCRGRSDTFLRTAAHIFLGIFMIIHDIPCSEFVWGLIFESQV